MKLRACLCVAVIAWAGLRAADTTNAPPREAAAPATDTTGVLAPDPKDPAVEVPVLRRIRDTFARRPADDGGDAMRDWLIAVVVRCEQFLADQPGSSRVAEVRALDAQCRLELSALTGERSRQILGCDESHLDKQFAEFPPHLRWIDGPRCDRFVNLLTGDLPHLGENSTELPALQFTRVDV